MQCAIAAGKNTLTDYSVVQRRTECLRQTDYVSGLQPGKMPIFHKIKLFYLICSNNVVKAVGY